MPGRAENRSTLLTKKRGQEEGSCAWNKVVEGSRAQPTAGPTCLKPGLHCKTVIIRRRWEPQVHNPSAVQLEETGIMGRRVESVGSDLESSDGKSRVWWARVKRNHYQIYITNPSISHQSHQSLGARFPYPILTAVIRQRFWNRASPGSVQVTSWLPGCPACLLQPLGCILNRTSLGAKMHEEPN